MGNTPELEASIVGPKVERVKGGSWGLVFSREDFLDRIGRWGLPFSWVQAVISVSREDPFVIVDELRRVEGVDSTTVWVNNHLVFASLSDESEVKRFRGVVLRLWESTLRSLFRSLKLSIGDLADHGLLVISGRRSYTTGWAFLVFWISDVEGSSVTSLLEKVVSDGRGLKVEVLEEMEQWGVIQVSYRELPPGPFGGFLGNVVNALNS